MIAGSPQFLRIEPDTGTPFRLGDLLAPRAEAVLAFLFGFLAFLPYPAIPAGTNSAVQTGSIVAILVLLPCLAVSWKGQPFYMAPLLLIPLCLSMFKVAFTGGGDLDLCFKSLSNSTLTATSLIAAQRIAPRQSLRLLTGIAAATLLHVVVGGWQLYAFSRGELPLVDLYINPSFLSVKDNAFRIAHYVRRPFGLFPEPSAMSSSLSPWVIFFFAEACGLVRLRRQPSPALRAFFITAATGAIGLIIASRSGHAAITLAALLILGSAWGLQCRATLRTYLTIVLVFCIIMPLCLWLAASALSDRVISSDGLADASWQARAKSLGIGFNLWSGGSAGTLIFGMGPGLTSPAILRTARLEAVWSVMLPYVYQTGILGILVICWAAYYLCRVWRASGFSSAHALMFCVWLVGIAVTTSYVQLLPLWVAMGWLTVWPEVCAPAVPAISPASIPAEPTWRGLDWVRREYRSSPRAAPPAASGSLTP
jgi:hypothetical protein